MYVYIHIHFCFEIIIIVLYGRLINLYQCFLTLDLHIILTAGAMCLSLYMGSRELKA